MKHETGESGVSDKDCAGDVRRTIAGQLESISLARERERERDLRERTS